MNCESTFNLSPDKVIYICKADEEDDKECTLVVSQGVVEIRGILLNLNKSYIVDRTRDTLINCLEPSVVTVQASISRHFFITDNIITGKLLGFIRSPAAKNVLVVSPTDDVSETLANYYRRMNIPTRLVDLDTKSGVITPMDTIGYFDKDPTLFFENRNIMLSHRKIIYAELLEKLKESDKKSDKLNVFNCFSCKFSSSYPVFHHILDTFNINKVIVFDDDRLFYTQRERFRNIEFFNMREHPRLYQTKTISSSGVKKVELKNIKGMMKKAHCAPLSCLPIGYKPTIRPMAIHSGYQCKDNQKYGVFTKAEEERNIYPVIAIVQFHEKENNFSLLFGEIPDEPLYLI
jgi:hypothetical protein